MNLSMNLLILFCLTYRRLYPIQALHLLGRLIQYLEPELRLVGLGLLHGVTMKASKLLALDSCHFNGTHFLPEIALIPQVVFNTAPETTDGAVWITSAADSEHQHGSLHYVSKALDFRIKNVIGYTGEGLKDAKVHDWRMRIRATLGANYDVIIEADHLHVELSPSGLRAFNDKYGTH